MTGKVYVAGVCGWLAINGLFLSGFLFAQSDSDAAKKYVYDLSSNPDALVWTEPAGIDEAKGELVEQRAALEAMDQKIRSRQTAARDASSRMRTARAAMEERRKILADENEEVRDTQTKIMELETELVTLREKLRKIYAEDEVIANAVARAKPAEDVARQSKTASVSDVHGRRRIQNRVLYLERWIEQSITESKSKSITEKGLQEAEEVLLESKALPAETQQETKYEK